MIVTLTVTWQIFLINDQRQIFMVRAFIQIGFKTNTQN